MKMVVKVVCHATAIELWSLSVFVLLLSFSSVTHAEKQPYSIGVQLPLSGPVASFGMDCKDGLELAWRDASPNIKERVKFEFEDDQVTPKLAVAAAQNFLRKPNLLALVTFSSSVGLAVSPMIKMRQVPMLALSGHPQLSSENPFVFDHWPDYPIEVGHFLHFVESVKARRIAILTLEHDYALALRKMFVQEAENRGLQIVGNETFGGDVDLRSVVSRFVKTGANLVFLNLFEPQYSTAVKQLRQQGYSGPILTLSGNVTKQTVQSIGAAASEGVTFFTIDHRYPTFLSKMKQLSREQHDVGYTFSCFMGMRRLVDAIESSMEDLTPSNVRAALSKITRMRLDDEGFEISDRRIQFKFVRGDSIKGEIKLSSPEVN